MCFPCNLTKEINNQKNPTRNLLWFAFIDKKKKICFELMRLTCNWTELLIFVNMVRQFLQVWTFKSNLEFILFWTLVGWPLDGII